MNVKGDALKFLNKRLYIGQGFNLRGGRRVASSLSIVERLGVSP